jgi:alpha-glucosidase
VSPGSTAFAVPWWRRAVCYEIYVRSFQDSNGDGIGDLAGITSRLDYLNDGTPDSLGVDALWLTPINPSPMHDFGYDVSDYTGVDPRFGTLAELDRLIAEAHRRGIRILLDLVPNHTSHEHAWFRAARTGRTAPCRDWYIWRDPIDGGPPNNWVSAFGGPAWTYDAPSGQYYLHSFLAEQPDLNYRNPAVVAAMEDVIRFWLDRGVDGFRIDVIHKLVKDAALRDNPLPDPNEDGHPLRDYFGQRHVYDENRPEVHEIIRGWRRVLDRYGDRMMVGEVYLLDPRLVAPYYGSAADELHLAFNFGFLWSPWDAAAFRAQVETIEATVPADGQPTYVLSSHDAPRHRSRFDDPLHGAARARLAALMLLTLRGTPFLYYGEELGMRDGDIPPERICDPVGRRFPALGRDPARTPMQWDDTAQAGFTTGAPWLPLGADYRTINAAQQRSDPASLLSFYRRAIWYRKTSAALIAGNYRSLPSEPETFVYVREHAAQRLLVALNFADVPRAVALPADAGTTVLATGGAVARSGMRLELPPAGGAVVELGV